VVLDGAGAEEQPLGNGVGVGAVGSRQNDFAFPGRQLAKVSGGHGFRMS